MARRVLATIATALAVLGVFSVGATRATAATPQCPNAGSYPPGQCTFQLDKTHGQAGTTVGANGERFSGNCTVTIRFDASKVGTAHTNAAGSWSTTVTVPANAKRGQHVISAVDGCSNPAWVMSQLFTVDAISFADLPHTDGGNPFANLPHTGTFIGSMAGAGAVLVLIGVLLIVAGRRRRLSTSVL